MAALPLFFQKEIVAAGPLTLPGETARHVVQVLRMQEGEPLQLTDGCGTVADCVITDTGKKNCQVVVGAVRHYSRPGPALHLCVGFTKNSSRNEWLLEKATELGVHSITPLQTSRTERERFRPDRWQGILVSAMLQSQQYYLPELRPPSTLPAVCTMFSSVAQKLVAHCIGELPRKALSQAAGAQLSTVFIIGPEGDLSPEEVECCVSGGFRPVSLGIQRLRTETAAMAVCTYFNLLNHE